MSLQENCAILKELVSLRAQKSRLLGFHTHADYVLEMNMAKTSQTVATFLGSHSTLAMGAHLCLEGHCHDRLWGRTYSRARLLHTHLPWLCSWESILVSWGSGW